MLFRNVSLLLSLLAACCRCCCCRCCLCNDGGAIGDGTAVSKEERVCRVVVDDIKDVSDVIGYFVIVDLVWC